MTSTKDTLQQEALFRPEELFFSHTDRRGIILFGNDVFIRVSEYSEPELMGKPHNIIRHADMPKTVFYLLWATILKDQPIIAYVKNRSKSGKFYWVLAFVVPFMEGFLSIRLKPLSPLLQVVEGLYEKICQTEHGNNFQAALQEVQQTLQNLGFSDYQEFMIHALVTELFERQKQMALDGTDSGRSNALRDQHQLLHAVEELSQDFKRLNKELKDLKATQKELRHLYINLSASAEKYGLSGAGISVTADALHRWGKEIGNAQEKFTTTCSKFEGFLAKSRFALGSACLETEMNEIFRTSIHRSEVYEKGLEELAQKELNHARDSLSQLHQGFQSLFASLMNLEQSVLAMKILRLSSRAEAIHTPDGGVHVAASVLQIAQFIDRIEKTISLISNSARTMRSTVDQLV